MVIISRGTLKDVIYAVLRSKLGRSYIGLSTVTWFLQNVT